MYCSKQGMLDKIRLVESKNRFIAIFDILGFESRFKHKGLDYMLHKYSDLLLEAYGAFGSSKIIDELHGNDANAGEGYAVISDTIIVWSKPIEDEEWSSLTLNMFFMAMYKLVNFSFVHFPLRGAIAYGQVVVDSTNNIYIGQPIIDAVRLEKEQDWIGVTCHESCYKLERFNELSRTNRILYYPVPFKSGEVRNRFVLNWTPGRNLETYREIIEREKFQAPDLAKQKYDNTLKFIERTYQKPPGILLTEWMEVNGHGNLVQRNNY